MLKSIKDVLRRTGVTALVRDAQKSAKAMAGRPRDRRLLKSYLESSTSKKLHLGAGKHVLGGWLNVDLDPLPGVIFLNVRDPFPLPDETFDHVFSEHLIEHIPYPDAGNMLSECFRVLKPGGRLRVATPEMAFMTDLLLKSDEQPYRDYVKWSMDAFVRRRPGFDDVRKNEAVFVVNNFFRDWGHQFIYDEAALSDALSKSGFAAIERCELGQSRDPALRNLENVTRMPEGFLRLETFVLEAQKP